MKDKDFERLSQEIRDVLLYNQEKSRALIEEINRMDFSDHAEDFGDELDKQLRFLRERGIQFDSDAFMSNIELPKRDVISVPELSWDEIVRDAREAGYKDVKIEDILTSAEIEKANKGLKEITDIFQQKTRLTKADIAFLTVAVILQVIRQYFITTLTKHESTATSQTAAEEYKNQYSKGGKYNNTYYRASKECILCQPFVPYDAIAGSKGANIAGEGKGIGGVNHRYYTMGHDPALSAIVGTSNILTNTMTVFDGRTFHIKYVPNKVGRERPTVVGQADTGKMFKHTWERIEQCCGTQFKVLMKIKAGKIPSKEEGTALVESFVPYAAYIKARRHLASDDSINGLPVPFLQLLSPEIAKELSEYGFDAAGVGQLIKDATKQALGSIIINFIISVLHGMICKVEYQEDLKFVKIRTRKILFISNLIATTSNVAITGVTAAIAACTCNDAMGEFAYKHMDIGGAVITMMRVFSDLTFISAVRDEFISGKMNEQLNGILKEIEEMERNLA